MIDQMKLHLVKIFAIILRFYFIHFHVCFGKVTIWNVIVCRYILWRHINIVAHLKDGLRFDGDLHDFIHQHIYFFGVWEPAITAYFKERLRTGDTVIDIGANTGAHALLAARLTGESGRVHAVEASPSIFNRLNHNLRLNHLDNVCTYNVAVVDRPRPVPIFSRSESILSGGTTIIASEAVRRGAIFHQVVDGRPLSDIIPIDELRKARLIKIDVEGSEWLVIQGMVDVLPTLPKDIEIIVEVNRTHLPLVAARFESYLRCLKTMALYHLGLRTPILRIFISGR